MVFSSINSAFYWFLIFLRWEETVCKVTEDSENRFTFIRNTSIFIDKTFLLKRVLKYEHMLITAPRKFGKSTNLHMIKSFFGNNNKKSVVAEIFRNTNIWRNKEFLVNHMCNYPIVYCSFKLKVHTEKFMDIAKELQQNVKVAFEEHNYLARSSKLETTVKKQYEDYCSLKVTKFTKGLRFLSELLYTHHNKKAIVLIDDYDNSIVQSIFTKELEIDKVARLVFYLLNETINGNKFIEKAIIMGTVPFKFGLNLYETFKFMESKDFSPYFGYTEPETEYLLDKFRLGKYKTTVSKWYGGYADFTGSFNIYSPWSVLMFIKTRKLEVYWVSRAAEKLLVEYIKLHFKLQQYIKQILNGKNVTFESLPSFTFKDITKLKELQSMESKDPEDYNLFLQLFLESGYLSYAQKYKVVPTCLTVHFPNMEIKSVFEQINNQLPSSTFTKSRFGLNKRFRGRSRRGYSQASRYR